MKFPFLKPIGTMSLCLSDPPGVLLGSLANIKFDQFHDQKTWFENYDSLSQLIEGKTTLSLQSTRGTFVQLASINFHQFHGL